MHQRWRFAIAGIAAGIINGMFGAGGGMVLVPLMTRLTAIEEDQVFPSSVSIILPICIISLLFQFKNVEVFLIACPYLVGGIIGGLLSGILAKKFRPIWLHRILGIMILWGGIRYLC